MSVPRIPATVHCLRRHRIVSRQQGADQTIILLPWLIRVVFDVPLPEKVRLPDPV